MGIKVTANGDKTVDVEFQGLSEKQLRQLVLILRDSALHDPPPRAVEAYRLECEVRSNWANALEHTLEAKSEAVKSLLGWE